LRPGFEREVAHSSLDFFKFHDMVSNIPGILSDSMAARREGSGLVLFGV
jgi:hypothetical protein